MFYILAILAGLTTSWAIYYFAVEWVGAYFIVDMGVSPDVVVMCSRYFVGLVFILYLIRIFTFKREE